MQKTFLRYSSKTRHHFRDIYHILPLIKNKSRDEETPVTSDPAVKDLQDQLASLQTFLCEYLIDDEHLQIIKESDQSLWLEHIERKSSESQQNNQMGKYDGESEKTN